MVVRNKERERENPPPQQGHTAEKSNRRNPTSGFKLSRIGECGTTPVSRSPATDMFKLAKATTAKESKY